MVNRTAEGICVIFFITICLCLLLMNCGFTKLEEKQEEHLKIQKEKIVLQKELTSCEVRNVELGGLIEIMEQDIKVLKKNDCTILNHITYGMKPPPGYLDMCEG